VSAATPHIDGAGATAPGGEMAIRATGVSRTFRSRERTVEALAPTDIWLAPGEFVTLLGPSGCGKSTLMKVVAGLLEPTSGEAAVFGESATKKRGRVAYMPQRDTLLPWRSVLANATLAMEVAGVPKAEARAEAADLLTRFGLGDFLDANPDSLSGGMRQRLALIRTVLFPRDVLLLDEPLGALDAQTRLVIQEWLLDLLDEKKKAVLFITHDVDEATYLSDRVYSMSARPGRVIDEVVVDLPRPRRQEVRVSPEFVAVRNRLLAHVHTEAAKAMEQAA
jgi:ABC-type nitrate/sulfonate/bicarbonate transport system ATPase subunit